MKLIRSSCLSVRSASVVFLYLSILQNCTSSSSLLQHPAVLWDQGRLYRKRMQVWFPVPSLGLSIFLIDNQEPLNTEASSLCAPCSRMARAQRMHTTCVFHLTFFFGHFSFYDIFIVIFDHKSQWFWKIFNSFSALLYIYIFLICKKLVHAKEHTRKKWCLKDLAIKQHTFKKILI